MPAPAGNSFWEARSSHGRKPIFSSSGELWDGCIEYFRWVEENPLQECKAFGGGKEGPTTINLPKMRAMTIAGLCIFLDIAKRTWDEYRVKEDFLPVCEQVELIIRDQKFTGAAADLLNANIIARDLGLADRNEHTGKDGGPVQINITGDDAGLL